jgi:hypothetical protein
MATVNPQLQARAGRNIGVEPSLYDAFLQDAGGPETDVNPTGDTVILECPQGMARSPLSISPLASPPTAGMIVNRTASAFNYSVLFVDDEGNEIVIGIGGSVGANSVNPFIYWVGIGFQGVEPWVLCPGEKIILRDAPVVP